MSSPEIMCAIGVQRQGHKVLVEIECANQYDAMQLVDGMGADMDKLGHTCLVIGQGAIKHEQSHKP